MKRLKVKGESQFHGGFRHDIGMYFRSGWEANWARYLMFQRKAGFIKDWEYETELFTFDDIKRGNRSYLPDFKVTYPDGRVEWHEVKGYMTQGARTKLKRMAKYHPKVKIRLIDREYYMEIKRKFSKVIPYWE